APPSVTLGAGASYYPGASVTAAGSDWSTGSGNVIPKWDDGTTLDAVGAALGAGSFSGYTSSLPSSASSGRHSIRFLRPAGATIERHPVRLGWSQLYHDHDYGDQRQREQND